jgi:oligopeptide/dipeptide ABC transporter ATP-binding protein
MIRSRRTGDQGTMSGCPPILEIKKLNVSLQGSSGEVRILHDVSLSCAAGEIVAIVGESGSGKTLTALSIIGMLPKSGRVSGSIRFAEREIVGLAERRLRELRGSVISMIYQNPRGSLNPALRIVSQMVEVIRRRDRSVTRAGAVERAATLLAKLDMRDPEQCLGRFPHQLSGGMCQRIALALALSGAPRMIIADEPTTALDVVVQAGTLALLKQICSDQGIALLIVTHDLGVVRSIADRVVVMYAGEVVENGTVDAVLAAPAHPYTAALIAALPGDDSTDERLKPIEGVPPDPAHYPKGCRFAPRCAFAKSECATAPEAAYRGNGAFARCHFPLLAA